MGLFKGSTFRKLIATGAGAGRLALLLTGVLGAGAVGAASCSDTGAGVGQAGPSAPEEGPIGQAQNALVSAQACVNIASGSGPGFTGVGNVYTVGINNGPSPSSPTSGTVPIGDAGSPAAIKQELMQFDLSPIPRGAGDNVLGATATLYLYPSSANQTINVHQATAAWNPLTVTWTSFNESFVATPLTSFNAGPTNTFNPTAPSPPPPNGVTFDLTSIVSGWLNNTTANDGLLLEQTPVLGVTAVTLSSNWPPTNSAYHPALNVCFTVTCAAGTEDCNNNGLDGCETNVTTVQSCGSCGNVCVTPNATPACVSGACAVGSCNLGFGDCDGNSANGCETMLTTSANCGDCGVPCALANASSSCATGTCTLTACAPGFFDCDGNPANGCEPLPCNPGQQCATSANCSSGVCVSGVCAPPTCTDGVKNENETDVDCGGVCPPCATGKDCNVAADCQSDVCTGGICQAATCTDGVKNGSETDVDCGGTTCPGCPIGEQCKVDYDCTSGVCVAGFCQAPACNDGVLNGSETGVDCGGGSCPACADAIGCNAASDCTSGVCTGGVCQVPSCDDGVQNGAETGPDCGGPCAACVTCTQNAGCPAGDTCQNGYCHGAACTGNGLGTITCGIGACQVTVPACTNGQPTVCTPGAPSAEVCGDGIDNDCNGEIDEGCPCVNGSTQPCYTGSAQTKGVGACHGGTQTCMHGQWGACAGEQTPTEEVCDGVDNDCNGVVDDDSPSTGLGCNTGKLGVCAPGMTSCTGGAIACNQNVQPSPEVCDGLDNNCDGQVDEGNPGGGLSCNTGKLGVCAVGTTQCSGGVDVCVQNVQPSPEVCDGLDNNCDGQVDEGLGSTTCGSPGCTVTVQNCMNGAPQTCNPARVNGQTCNDGNACTDNDVCTNGTCAGTAYSCAAPDQCHQAGTCNGDGTCSFAPKANGTSCNDGNGCTTGDVCTNGVCAGVNQTGAACSFGVGACASTYACFANVLSCKPATCCGDGVCNGGENCHTCPADCGQPDACSVCGGNNSEKGCDGVCFSGKTVDSCGVCGGNNSEIGCDGRCFSGLHDDACGVCGGNNSEIGCNGVCFSGVVDDACGVCGGNNSEIGCDGRCFSGLVDDACGVCGGNNSEIDACGVCFGNGSECGGCPGCGRCPSVYAEGSDGFAYETSVGGAAMLGDGIRREGRRIDFAPLFARLDHGRVTWRGEEGAIGAKILATDDEIVYLDEAHLTVVTHPEGYEVLTSSSVFWPMLGRGDPGEMFALRSLALRAPVSATWQGTTDVTAAIGSLDDEAVAFDLHTDNAYDLDFGQVVDPRHARLVVDGWKMRQQRDLSVVMVPRPPRLEVQQPDGAWKVVLELGYPRGDRKATEYDLSAVSWPEGRYRMRLWTGSNEAGTSMWYIDRVRLTEEAPVPVETIDIAPKTAELSFSGAPTLLAGADGSRPRLSVPDGRGRMVDEQATWGAFTRYGDVRALLGSADDMFAIMRRGDVVDMRFEGIPRAPSGKAQTLFLRSDLLFKPRTETGKTEVTEVSGSVWPLPFHGMTRYPLVSGEHYPTDEAHRRYLEKYNTRTYRRGETRWGR